MIWFCFYFFIPLEWMINCIPITGPCLGIICYYVWFGSLWICWWIQSQMHFFKVGVLQLDWLPGYMFNSKFGFSFLGFVEKFFRASISLRCRELYIYIYICIHTHTHNQMGTWWTVILPGKFFPGLCSLENGICATFWFLCQRREMVEDKK